jgi:hypothetical protein
LLVEFAYALQDLANTLEVSELAADLRDVTGVDGDLASLGARIVDVEDELKMAYSGGTGGAGDRGGVKGVTFEQGAAEKIRKWGELAEEFPGRGGGLLASHPYRCYNRTVNLSRHFLPSVASM